MQREPLRRELCDFFERARLREQVCGPGNDLHLFFTPQLAKSPPIQFHYRLVISANDQQCWSLNQRQSVAGQIRSTSSGNDSFNTTSLPRSGSQCSCRAGAGAEVAQIEPRQVLLVLRPVGGSP